MDNKRFIENINNVFKDLKNYHSKFKIEESVKGMFPVLKILYFNDNVTPKFLETNLCVSSARVARVLNQLEEKGLVSRIESKDDKRKTIVILTQAGKDISKKQSEEFDKYIDIMLENISDTEKEEFIYLLRKMANNIKGAKKNV